ncbi:MAG: hypothetical protein Q7J82_09485 [Coriobacteriia bacterium]|nr:hypothetical protein [Coriobacteriia bacterium]
MSDAARLAGLTPAGARKALARLEESGVIERVGGGRTQQYGLRRKEPITETLALLFAQEQERYDGFMSSLRQALADLHEVKSAWVESLPSPARGPVEVVVAVETKSISWIGEELRSRLGGLEKEFDLIIEVAVFTRADAPRPGPEALFLWTTEPDAELGARSQLRMHGEAEERSLIMAQGIAELIRSDPSLIKRAMQHVNRLLHDGQGTAAGDIGEWRQLLETYSPERLRELLVSASSRAVRLRQSAPFFAVLTAEERDRLMALVERSR